MDLHLDTPQSPRVMVIPQMEMERDWQQESACGFCHYWGGVYHYWVIFIIIGVFPFIFEFPNINCQGPQSCLQAGLRLCQMGQGNTNPHGNSRERPGHRRYPKISPKAPETFQTKKMIPFQQCLQGGNSLLCGGSCTGGSPSPGRSPSSLSNPSFWTSRWELPKFSWT